MDKVLEIGGLVAPPQKGGVNVEVSQNVAVQAGKGGFMERIIKTSDEILYGKANIVEAEKVERNVLPENSVTEQGEAGG